MARKPAKRSKKKAPRDLKARKDVKGGLMATRLRIRGPIGITGT
jgi:hypothetical protein